MAISQVLQVILTANATQYKAEMRAAAVATGQLSTHAAAAQVRGEKLGQVLTTVGTAAKFALAFVAVRAVKDFVSSSVTAAKDLNETFNAINRTFGRSADTITDFGVVAAQTAGLSQREFQQMATVTGSILTNVGLSMADAAKESVRLTQRAGDLASVFNTDVGEALDAINSSLVGQQRPLRQFGISIDDVAIRARAVELGLANATSEVDEHGKKMATLSLIYEQSNKVAGDFVATSGELANQQRILAATAENNKAAFGQALIPVLSETQGLMTDIILSFSSFSDNEARAGAARAALRMGEAVEYLNGQLAEGRPPMDALADAVLHLAENGEVSSSSIEALAAAAGLNDRELRHFTTSVLAHAEAIGIDAQIVAELRVAFLDLHDPQAGVGKNFERGRRQAEDHAGALDEVAEASRTVADRQQAINDAYFAAANPLFAATQAVGRMREAQEHLVEVQKDTDSTADDIAEAQLAVAEATLIAEGHLRGLSKAEVSQGIRAIAQGLRGSKEEAEALLVQLGLLDGKRVRTYISTTQTTITDTRTYRQHGGPVSALRPYIVGEAGPELFVPQMSGQIIPNHQLASAGGGGTWQVSVSGVTDVPRLAEAIVREGSWQQRVSAV